MKTAKLQRILALALTLAMMMSMILVFTVSGSAENANSTYVLNAEDIKAFAVAAKYDGEYERAGTNNFFTLIYSAKTKVESNSKTFPDGQPFTQRIAWGDKSYVGDQVLNTIKIKTNGSAKIKIWWACGDAGRVPAVYSQTGAAVATVQIPFLVSLAYHPDESFLYVYIGYFQGYCFRYSQSAAVKHFQNGSVSLSLP